MKFSIIVPVYNVEKYISDCLDSILNQTYNNFEVIVVNDGTLDNSQKIIDTYVEKDTRFKSYIKENGGLSDARNYGLKYVSGDYLLFVDSDDYINKDLLKKLNEVLLKNKYDIIKFKIALVDENKKLISNESGPGESKIYSLKEALNQEYSETAWTYCYNFKFWEKNNFKYAKGKLHEDFGLTPLILAKAKSLYYLNYCGYNYLQRKGSIVNGGKNLKRASDTLFHFDYLYKEINKLENLSVDDKDYIISYIANGLIYTSKLLEKKDLKDYINELKKRNVFDLLLDDTISRKLKKILIKANPYFYISILKCVKER